MSLHGHYLSKFPALCIIFISRIGACAHRVTLAVLCGGQPASAESYTHPAKRDHWLDGETSNCQMSELVFCRGPIPDTQNWGLRMRRECRECFPRYWLQVSYPGMHIGTCVTHVPWWMSGSLTRGAEETVPCITGACATRTKLETWNHEFFLWWKLIRHSCVLIITVVRLMKPTAVGFIRYGRRRSDRIRTARFVW